MAYAFNIEHLYSETNKGLDIIKFYLGNCKDFDKALQNPKNAFFSPFRQEDTASAYLVNPDKKLKSATVDYYRVKDYGDEFYTPIKIAMFFTGMDFYPCLKYLYQHFNLIQGKSYFQAETEVTTLDKNDKRAVGWYNIVFKETHHDLKVIGNFVTPEIAKQYHFKSVDYYEKVFIKKGTENKTYIKVTATESFPIFAYAPAGEKWCKLYAPLSNDKQYKHGYLGTKPERYIHGLDNFYDLCNTSEIDQLNELIERTWKNSEKEALIRERDELMINTLIICSGGSDGLNVASLGYPVLWFNSESEQISYAELQKLKPYVKTIYNLPDVDTAGTKYAYEVAENHWELKTIWLPKEKLGATGKDFRDWMRFYNNANLESIKFQFSKLIAGALKMKFFDRVNKTLKIKPSYLHYFLKVKGFYLYYPEKQFTDKIAEQEYIFIRIEENIVTQVFPNQIRKFCERYLIAKGQTTEVIDLIKSTVQFTDKNLMGLDDIVLDFRNYTMRSQTFFFNNLFATVTAEKIDLQPYKKYENYVWNDAKLKNNILPENPFFQHYKDEQGEDKIKILRSDCEFMNFLINTSRMYWRKELEEPFNDNQQAEKQAYHEANRFNLFGDCLTEEEKHIQELHFLNKCFSIGYLLHKQKRQSFAKSVYAMDDKPKESEDDANGRSGKSLVFFGLDQLATNRFLIDGKNKNLTTDKHVLHGLTKENDYLYIEDLDQFVSFEFFYNWITGSTTVNPKNSKPYEIKFFDSPKIAFTSNYGLPKCSPSTLGRILFMSFSDYYHVKTDRYKEERKVNQDFNGIDLFSNLWTEKQWNIHYNFLMQCVQLYLQNFDNEINAPQNNIDINNAMASMGDSFISWCDSYFVETQTIDIETIQQSVIGEIKSIEKETIIGTLNEYVSRAEMQNNYNKAVGRFPKSANHYSNTVK